MTCRLARPVAWSSADTQWGGPVPPDFPDVRCAGPSLTRLRTLVVWFFSSRRMSQSLGAIAFFGEPLHAESAPPGFDLRRWVNKRKAYEFQEEGKKKELAN